MDAFVGQFKMGGTRFMGDARSNPYSCTPLMWMQQQMSQMQQMPHMWPMQPMYPPLQSKIGYDW